MRRNAGFTAFEVAVTLAIIAIMASVVMPGFLQWLQGHRLRGAAINLLADVEMAKIRAMRENAFVAVFFEANRYRILVDNGAGGALLGGVAGDWIQNGTETIILERPLPAGVRLDVAENYRIRFNGRGIPPEVAGTEVIPLVSDAGRREVRVNRLGSATSG
jgi:prepilin-type N-terminal cleavage/methylation domain-containing protein